MGQYHVIVNLDKCEYLKPHDVGDGLKWWEQAASEMGTMTAVWAAITCPEPRGGGDPGAHPWVGRWHGDRVVMVGDYAEDSDRPDVPQWSALYMRADDPADFEASIAFERARLNPDNTYRSYAKDPAWIDAVEAAGPLIDVSAMARDFLTQQFGVRFSGSGWLQRSTKRALAPDVVIGLDPLR